MANADRCACCGAIIPEGSHVCPNCKVAVKPDDSMDAYAYLAKYMKEVKPKQEKKPKKDLVEVVRCKDCKHWGCQENSDPNFAYFCNADALYAWGRPVRYQDDFCSYGERKYDG